MYRKCCLCDRPVLHRENGRTPKVLILRKAQKVKLTMASKLENNKRIAKIDENLSQMSS